MRSRSSGVMTSRATPATRSLARSARSSRVAASPRRSRSASHVVPRRWYGANCTYADTTCGRRRERRIGDRRDRQLDPRLSAKPPYLAASNARSMRRCRARAGRVPRAPRPARLASRAASPVNRGSADTAKLTFASVPCARMFCTRRTNSGSRCIGSTSPSSVRFGSAFDDDGARGDRLAGRQRDAGAAPSSATSICAPRRRFGSPRRPAARPPPGRRRARPGRPRRTSRSRSGCPSPAPSSSSTRGAAGRPRAEERSEHAAGGDRRAQRLALEPFADEIGDRHRHPPQQPVRVGLAERAKPAAGLQELAEIGRRSGRRATGGAELETARSTPLIAPKLARNARVLFGVLRRERPDLPRPRAPRSCQSMSERPSGVGAQASRRAERSAARGARARARRHDRGIDRRRVRQRRAAESRRELARARAAADAIASARGRAVFSPAFARKAAATRPLCPPPMTMHDHDVRHSDQNSRRRRSRFASFAFCARTHKLSRTTRKPSSSALAAIGRCRTNGRKSRIATGSRRRIETDARIRRSSRLLFTIAALSVLVTTLPWARPKRAATQSTISSSEAHVSLSSAERHRLYAARRMPLCRTPNLRTTQRKLRDDLRSLRTSTDSSRFARGSAARSSAPARP